MAALGSPAFHYTEGAARSGMAGWCSSFTVFTFSSGRLLWQEMVHVVDEAAGLFTFRGRLHSVADAVLRCSVQLEGASDVSARPRLAVPLGGQCPRANAEPEPEPEADIEADMAQPEPEQSDADFLAELDRLKADFRASSRPEPEPSRQPKRGRRSGFWQGTGKRGRRL
jgi:hypothetical protein